MTLIRNIFMALVAMFVLGVAAPASAKTLTEVVACRDAGFAAAPFMGTTAQKERQAKSLVIGTEVLVDNVTVKLDAGDSLWSRCKTGPSALEVATAKVTALETENARLRALAYTRTSKGPVSWRSVATSHASQITDLNGKLDAAKAAIKSEKFFGKLWLVLGLITLTVLVVLFWTCSKIAQERNLLKRRLDAAKSAPSEESTLGKMHDGPTPHVHGTDT